MSRLFVLILCVVVFSLGFVVSKAIEKQSQEIATVSLNRKNIEKSLSLSGFVEPERVIDVRSIISGTLNELFVEVGDVVAQGAPLASVRFVKDPVEVRKLRDNIEVSQKRLDVVTARFQRSESLYKDGFVSLEEYETLAADFAATQKNHETLVAELAMVTGEHTHDMIPNVINATNGGTVVELPIKEGGSVMARGSYSEGSVIARLADFGSMVFESEVSEVDVAKIKIGMPVELTVAMSPNCPIRAVVKSIAPTATRSRGITTYKVFASVNLDKTSNVTLFSGCSATGRIVTQRADSAWCINEKYLHYEGDSVFVNVVNPKGKVLRRYVKVGVSDGIDTQILAGVDSLSLIKAED